jgi:lipopolysaccharide export system permease protein
MLWTPEIGETIFAQRGRLAAAGEDVGVVLEEGAVLTSRERGVDLLRFATLETKLAAGKILERDERDRVLSLSLAELAAQARVFVPTEGHRLSPAELERQRRFAYPVATLVFGFLAVPLFLTRTHATRSAGAVMGLVCTLAYYGLVQLSEGLVQAGMLGPGVAAWIPNAALAALACGLLVRALRRRVLGRPFDRRAAFRLRDRRAPAAGYARPVREPRLHHHALVRYVASRFVQVTALTFSALFAAYLLIDVMDRLDWFAEHGATGIEALRYYGARIPLLASRAVPLAILFASSLTVSLLAVEGELLGMRACGIPALRALLPGLAIAALVAPLYFAFNNTVLPRTNALADQLKRTEIRARTTSRAPRNIWQRSGNMVLQADHFDAERGVGQNVTIYWLGNDELPVARTDAESMHHVGRGNWRLVDSSRIEVDNGTAHRVEPRRYVELGESIATEVDTRQMSAARIAREAEETEAAGFDASTLRVDYHAKLAEPFSCIVLPAAVLFFAATGPPFPGPAQTLLVSGVIGVAYILFTAVATSLGHGGRIPPALGGWAPVAVFALIAASFGRRMWRRH